MEILKYEPKYVEFLIEDGDVGQMGGKMFPEWAQYKNVGITADEVIGV